MAEMTQQTPAPAETPAQSVPPAPPAPKQQNKAKKQKRKKVIRTVIILAVLAVVLGVGGYFMWTKIFHPPEEKGEILTDFVSRSSIVSKVEGSGNTKAQNSATITPEVGGTILELFVKEGDYVTEGQQLYRMDDTEAREAVQKAQENVNDIQKQLDDIYDSYNDLTISAPHSGKMIDIAELKVGDDVTKGTPICTVVDDTKLKLSLYFSYAYENDIAVGQSAQISIPATMSTLTGAVETINKVRYIVPEGSVLFEVVVVLDNPGTLTQDMEATATLKAADGTDIYPYESGKFTYYQTSKMVAKVDGPVEELHLLNYADIQKGGLLVQLGAKNNDKEISDKKEALKTAQKTLDDALEKQGNFNAVAPIDGTVISCGLIEGAKVEASQGISIADTSVMTVEIQVDERNIGYVKPGMMVELSRYNENFYTGIVESVSQTANAQNGVATFPVIVKVDNSDGALMSNMYIQYSFVASQSDNCLVVPVQAVKYVSFSGAGGQDMMGGEDGMLPTDGDMLPADGDLPTDGGDASLPEETLPAETDGTDDTDGTGGTDAAEPSVDAPADGGVVALPASAGGGVTAQPLSVIVSSGGGMVVMGGGGSGGGGGSANTGDGTGTVCFVKADTAPENAIAEPDPSWEVPEGFYAVPVTVGLADTVNVEITSGLNEGDEVFIGYATQNASSWG